MSYGVNNSLPVSEQSFCELVKKCRVGELGKRVAKAVANVFIALFKGLYTAIAWTCKTVSHCIYKKKGEAVSGEGRPVIPSLPSREFEQKVKNLYESPITTEELRTTLYQLPESSEERRIYAKALQRRENVLIEPNLDELSKPLVLSILTPLLPIEEGMSAEEKGRITEQNKAIILENQRKALEHVQEFTKAVEPNLLKALQNPQKTLENFAERETGTPQGTLAQAPYKIFERLKATPRKAPKQYVDTRTNSIQTRLEPNPARAALWPEGVRAADRFTSWTEKDKDAYILRYAQIQTLESRYHLNPELSNFNMDIALQNYSSTHPTGALKKWYSDFSDEVSKYDYERALDAYAYPGGEKEIIVAKLLSQIYDLVEKTRTKVEGSPKEEELNGMVRTLIRQVVDGNKGCVDQMNSQLESLALDFLAFSSEGGDPIKFKAGLAISQYRSKLIQAFTQELYPDVSHGADLERDAKKRLADDLGLRGTAMTAGAAYNLFPDIVEKSQKIGTAALIKHNPPLFMVEEFEECQQSVPATFYCRDEILKNINNLLGMDELDTMDPLVQELSKEKGDGMGRADERGKLTFEATLFYLEAAGILKRNN